MKQIKQFYEQNHKVKLDQLHLELESYKQMLKMIKELDSQSDSVQGLEKVYNEKTGFLNPKVSFEAYNLLPEYNEIKSLQARCSNLNPRDLDKNLNFKSSFLTALKEEYTVYYSDDELKALERIEAVMVAFNELSSQHRSLLWINQQKELAKSPFFNRQF